MKCETIFGWLWEENGEWSLNILMEVVTGHFMKMNTCHNGAISDNLCIFKDFSNFQSIELDLTPSSKNSNHFLNFFI